ELWLDPGSVLWWLSVGLLWEQFIGKSGASLHVCPAVCICASDLLSCVSQNLSVVPARLPETATSLDLSHNLLLQLHDNRLSHLPRLTTLRANHNRIARIAEAAFPSGSLITHLDLSTNRLYSVEKHFFRELTHLEELLLYNNQIARVDEGALARLSSLQKVYLSWNQLTHFPFGSLHESTLPRLKIVDISSNWFSSIPVDQVIALSHNVKNGLYLHNNPLVCDCVLYSMLLHWEKYQFSSIYDFQEEHTCRAAGQPRVSLRFLKHRKLFDNCTYASHGLLGLVDNNYVATVGESLLIVCNTSLQELHTTYVWITPNKELIGYPGSFNKMFKLYPNGSLEIRRTQKDDSGIYICMATNKQLMRNESQEVNVTVLYRKSDGEGFNTGLTTLLGCVVSLVLVLMYLYLTPCRCWCKTPPPHPTPPNECSAQSSILSATPPCNEDANRKTGGGKHVVFLEPVKDSQNGKIRLAVSEDFPDVKNPKILQLKSDSESITSVFSDTPIMS
uniref:Adhesion molecule with Ig like domain 3 n=1 Tax=Callorhinchus milii TaxID=7868 RepID=A0A4W3GUX4_CALMI